MTSIYEFAHLTVYKRSFPSELDFILPVLTSNNGILIDSNIKDEWINSLLTIKQISLFSLFSGVNKYFISHIIFSMKQNNTNKCDLIVSGFNKKRIKSSYFMDSSKVFFCLATRNWYRTESESINLIKWWTDIPSIISEVLNV